MSVRWKPLLLLSGLCVVFAMLGVLTMAFVLAPRTSPVQLARTERASKDFKRAEIHYRQALQKDGKNPRLLEEVAEMYGDWAETATTDRAKYRLFRIKYLADAAKYGKSLIEPRRQLLVEAIRQGDTVESQRWAKELLALDPQNRDAHYVLAQEALSARPPSLDEARPHLAVLDDEQPPRLRTLWLRARAAQEADETSKLEEILAQARSTQPPSGVGADDGIALIQLRALDATRTTDPTALAERVEHLRADAQKLTSSGDLSAVRIAQLSSVLEQVQDQLTKVASQAKTADKPQTDALDRKIETVAEKTFQDAIAGSPTPDLRLYQAYAEHLLARNDCAKCLEIVDKALKLPVASLPALYEPVMNLREIALRAALTDSDDPERFDRAQPYLKELLSSKHAHYEGLGHLFAGAIALERSNLANGAPPANGEGLSADQIKLRDDALKHLQRASEQLPRVAAAQALYGVCLIFSQETALGRQYLLSAQKLGNLEPRYQVWAAWSMVQAGYPEEAEPIVKQLRDGIAQGTVPADLKRTLHLLSGEIHQARRTPAELQKALAEYAQAFPAGQKPTPDVQLRQAQIEIMLGQIDQGTKRLEALRASGQGGASADRLAVLALLDQKKNDEARALLAQARSRYPQSAELVSLQVATLVKADQSAQADKILADFLAKNPGNLTLTQLRAQLLAEKLNKFAEARKLLAEIADTSGNSGPLVQLALLDLAQGHYDAVKRTIARIQSRWKQSAAADQLSAQLAVAQKDYPAALAAYEAALKKDPTNKVIQLAKAEIELQMGASAAASRELEDIARNKPVKEIDPGVTLASAAQSALVTQALEEGDYDGAIQRLEQLLRDPTAGNLARAARWQLVAAKAAKGQWPAAKQEMLTLLNDAKNPPTPDERVRAAQLYRLHKEDAAALAQLDLVLKQSPAHPQAVVIKAYMLITVQPPKTGEALALLRQAIATSPEPPGVFYLVLAAVENIAPPTSEGLKRAEVAIDQGLKKYPDSSELWSAKYRVVRLQRGAKPALDLIASKAKADPRGPFRKLLAESYREDQDYAQAEQVVASLLAESPKDRTLAEEQLRLVVSQAIQAADRGNTAQEKSFNNRALVLIRQYRAQFPTDQVFPQTECELALRQGDLARAVAIADQVDGIDPNSAVGPLLHAQIYSAQGRTSEVVKAFREALDRNPKQPQVRLWLAQASLALGDTAEALGQVGRVLEASPDHGPAIVLKARALAVPAGSPSQTATNQAQAVQLLTALIQKQPKLSDAYHQLAQIQRAQHRRAESVATLKKALAAVPEDAAGLELLAQFLTEPNDRRQPASPAEIQEARQLAEQYGGKDEKGTLCLALSYGFEKGGQLELALAWAERAAKKMDSPRVHLNYGSLLLTSAEQTGDKSQARAIIERALAEYDRVLRVQPNSIEAVNNKAWMLYRYLGNNQAALDLAEGLMRRSDRSALPGEFFDTLGAVQEALGKTREAEASYAEGLRKAPDQPVLNFHMGRLLATAPNRSAEAREHLERSMAAADRLPRSTLSEVEMLLKRLNH